MLYLHYSDRYSLKGGQYKGVLSKPLDDGRIILYYFLSLIKISPKHNEYFKIRRIQISFQTDATS